MTDSARRLIDDPGAARPADHPQPPREAQRAQPHACAATSSTRSRPTTATTRCGCRSCAAPAPASPPATTSGGGNEGLEMPHFTAPRRGPLAPPRHRDVDGDLGPGQAGDRAGARLLPGRRQRAGHRLRPRLRGRGRQDGLPGRALRRARHAVPRLVPRDAGGHGDDGHRRLDLRASRPCGSAGPTGPSRRPTSTTRCSRWRSGSPCCRPTSCSSTSAPCTAPWTTWACRHSIRAGTELCSLGTKQPSFQEFIEGMRAKGLTDGAAGARRALRRLPDRCRSPLQGSGSADPVSPRELLRWRLRSVGRLGRFGR